MTDSKQSAATQTGDELFEAFVDQIKQALEHLYDFAYLQQHPLARSYDGDNSLSAKTAGRQLRNELINAVEALKPKSEAQFRASEGRLYNLLHLIYIEHLTIQEAATELALSERQAYRDLRRGQETVASALWNNRLPSTVSAPLPLAQDFSLQAEMSRLKLNIQAVEVPALFQQAAKAVERLAAQHGIDIVLPMPLAAATLSTDPTIAQQVIVSVLSTTIQQAQAGELAVSLENEPSSGAVFLELRYRVRNDSLESDIGGSATATLAQRLHWNTAVDDLPDGLRQLRIRMISSLVTIIVIDDNAGWVALIERFMEGQDSVVVGVEGNQDGLQRIQQIAPNAIILDVMMPDKDGWEILQRLRTNPITASIPIIVCTVFNDPPLAYSLGASAFITKPTTQDVLLSTLRKLNIV